ncbi:unnamed protein product [Effrenium voratum]|nr:unnamed protein product [Effrenium voratum]
MRTAPQGGSLKELARTAAWREALQRLEPEAVPCTQLMTALLRLGHWQKSLQVFDLLRAAGKCDAVAFNVGISAYVQGGQWQQALALLKEAREHSQADGIGIGAVLAAVDRWPLAMEVLWSLREAELQVEDKLCSAAVSSCSKAKQWRAACAASSGAPRNTEMLWNALISACDRGHRWRTSLLLFRAMQSQFLGSEVSHSAALHASGAGQWQACISLLGEMDGRYDLSIITMNTAMTLYTGAGRWHFSLLLFSNLPLLRLRSDRITWTAAIGAAQSARLWQEAVRRLKAMDADPVALNTALQAVGWAEALRLLRWSYAQGMQRSCLPSCAAMQSCERWPMALLLFQDMAQDLPPDVVARNLALTALGRGQRWEQALDAIVEQDVDIIAYSTVMGICGEWQVALRLFWLLCASRMRLDSLPYMTAISACGSNGQWQLALGVLKEYRTSRLTEVGVFNAAMTACTKAIQWHKAFHLFQDIGASRDKVTWGATHAALEASNRWRLAFHFAHISVAHCQADSFFIASSCEKASEWPQALHLLAPVFRGRLDDSVAWNLAATAGAKVLEWQRGLARLSAESFGLQRLPAYDATLQACARAGKADHAWEVLAASANRPALSFLWALSVLCPAEALVIHKACVEAATAASAAPEAAALFLYATAMLGAQNWHHAAFRAMAVRKIADLDMDQLVMLAGAADANAEFLEAVASQAERLANLMAKTHLEQLAFDRQGLKLLGVLFSCALADCLPRRVFATSLALLRRVGAAKDAVAGEAATQALAMEGVSVDTPHMAVVRKACGWEVYGGHSPRQLADLAKTCWGQRRIFQDLNHRQGWMHRLDVPSSGLLVLAKSYEAFYDLQAQLHAGLVERGYTALCHGWVAQGPVGRWRPLRARIFWHGAQRAVSGGRGRASCTWLWLHKHLQHPLGALSSLSLRLSTGRKHQIRSHLAHLGHPVVSDQVYQSAGTWGKDLEFYKSNWLHRHRLSFQDLDARPVEVSWPVPAAMTEMLRKALVVKNQSLPRKDPGVMDLLEAVSDARGLERSGGIFCQAILGQRSLGEVEDLIAQGANVEASQDLSPVLAQAVQAQQTELVKLLLRQRASAASADAKGVTPLHLATFDGSLDIMKLLIGNRANLESRDCHDQTPFFFVPNRRACMVLGNAKADPNVLNHKGQSPLHLAAHAGLNDAVQWLADNMSTASLNAQDKHGRTAVYCAAHSSLKSTILLLHDKGVDMALRPKKHRGKSQSTAGRLLDDIAKKAERGAWREPREKAEREARSKCAAHCRR